MTLQLTESELIEAVSDFLRKKGVTFKTTTIAFSCEWDQQYDANPHSFTAKVELAPLS